MIPQIEYDRNTAKVCLRNLTLYFSYTTVIAFYHKGKRYVRENDWGPTTGKHLNAIDGGDKEAKKERMNSGEFEAALTLAATNT